jgi:Pretoxin HINT domain
MRRADYKLKTRSATTTLIPAPSGWGEAPEGWVWHHALYEQANNRFGVLQLVPQSQHTSGELQVTGEHPVWTQNRKWVNAKDLVGGDRLLDSEGVGPQVVSTISVPAVTTTYNLSVEKTHAFFVMAGKTSILVHNTDIDLHHPWPQYLGGPANQDLVPVDAITHQAYHNLLDDAGLPRNLGGQYYQDIWAISLAQKLEDMQTFKNATQAFDETYGTSFFNAAKQAGMPIPCD